MLSRSEYCLLFVVQVLPYLLYAIIAQDGPIPPIEFKADDAYFYFKVAENIVKGLGFTFDGITPTSGCHPLWTIFLTPIFYIFDDKIMPLRAILVLNAVLLYATLLALLALLRSIGLKRDCSFVVVFLLGVNSVWHLLGMCGMEFALNIFLMTLFLYFYQKNISGIWFGLTGGLLFLARLDNVFLICIVYLFLFFKNRFKKPDFIAAGITATFAVLFFIWNLRYFGYLMPISGLVKEYWGQVRSAFPPIWYLLHDFLPGSVVINFKYWHVLINGTGAKQMPFSSLGFLCGCGLLGAFIVLGVLLYKQRKALRTPVVYILLLSVCIHVSWYAFRTHFAGAAFWYWAVEWVLLAVLIALALNRLFPASFPVKIILVFILVVYFPRDFFNRQPIVSEQTGYQEITEFLERNTEPRSIIGMPGCGIPGYHIKNRTIINIDGLTGSYEYFEALKRGGACKILRDYGMDYAFLLYVYPFKQCEDYLTLVSSQLKPFKLYKFTMEK